MKTVPATFFESQEVEVLMRHGNACILYKKVQKNVEENERFVALPALTLVLSGTLQVEDARGNLTQAGPGQCVFLPKGLYFVSDLIPVKGSFEAVVFFFEPEMMAAWAGEKPANAEKPENMTILSPGGHIQHFLKSMRTQYRPLAPVEGPVCQAKLQEFLFLLEQDGQGEALRSAWYHQNQGERLPLKPFMEMYGARPLSVEDYAWLTKRSISSFHRDFKKIFGESPKSWLITRRMAAAKEQLETEEEIIIEDLARSLGYQNTSHFIKLFKDHFGDSPGQYAQTYRETKGY